MVREFVRREVRIGRDKVKENIEDFKVNMWVKNEDGIEVNKIIGVTYNCSELKYRDMKSGVFASVISKSDHVTNGFMKIDAGGKTKTVSCTYSEGLFVAKGESKKTRIVLRINDVAGEIPERTSFRIPIGNEYSIENVGEEIAILSYNVNE